MGRCVRQLAVSSLAAAVGLWCLAGPAADVARGSGAASLDDREAATTGRLDLAGAIAARVSESRLRQTVRDLVALGPRMGGTPSGDRASAFLADAFGSYGLGVRVHEDTPVRAYWPERWHVRVGPAAETLGSAWPELFSPPIDPPRVARLLPVSEGEAARPTGERGLVVYAPRLGRAEYRRLSSGRVKPLAILTSTPNEPGRYTAWASLGHAPLESAATAVPVFALGFEDGLAAAEAARRGHTVDIGLRAYTRRASPRTVVATLPGARVDRYYLVTAHGDSDSGGPGADDNASGVAVVLELARVLAELRHERVVTLPFAVRFAVWGREYDSARDYIRREGEAPLGACAGVINIDQAGTGAEREAVYVEGNDVPWNRDLLRAFDAVGREFRGRSGYWPEFATTPAQGGTDAYAFLPTAYKGAGWTRRQVPSVTLYTAAWDTLGRLTQTPGWATDPQHPPGTVLVDYSRYYHSSGDVPEHTTEREPQNMVRVTKAIGATLARLP